MSTSTFEDCFANIKDPRVKGRTESPVLEIIFLCISSILCGMDGWEDIEDFGHSKLDWLQRFFPFENGIPKHDTIARVISRLSPNGLQNCFVEWVQSISNLTDGEVVAIDGKRARRSYDKKTNKSAIHMVSAWACNNGLAKLLKWPNSKPQTLYLILEKASRFEFHDNLMSRHWTGEKLED